MIYQVYRYINYQFILMVIAKTTQASKFKKVSSNFSKAD